MSAEIIQHTAGHHLSVPSIYDNKKLVTRNCDPVTFCGNIVYQNNFPIEESTFAKSSTSLKSTTNSTTTYITSPRPSTYPTTLPGLGILCCLYFHCH